MKRLQGYIYFGSLCAGMLFVEYEILQRVGVVFVVCASACVLGTLAGALYRAPEGDERAEGLDIRAKKRPSGFISSVRSSQRQLKRGWT
jgi:hypothetical protein